MGTLLPAFLDPEGGSQKATIVVLVVGISSLGPEIPKAFLVRSGVQ